MTFEQEFVLMIADKLIIGAIIGLTVYLATKRLERFKADQSLEGEIAKQRVDNIAKGWQALNAWDLAVTDLICEFARIIREQHPKLKADEGLDELGQPDLKKIADWLATEQGRLSFNSIRARCKIELKHLLKKSEEQSDKARAIMQENRFWFGRELYEHCFRFHTALHGLCTAFGRQNFEGMPKQLRNLDDVRQDVLVVLQEIRSIPRKGILSRVRAKLSEW